MHHCSYKLSRRLIPHSMMKDSLVLELLEKGLQDLLHNDPTLIADDLSEQSITHRLGLHLARRFPDFDVDCEYNGNIDEESGRKRIGMLRIDLEQAGLLKKTEKTGLEAGLIARGVFPDIIVHKRHSNESNLCIIEVKKSTSKVESVYDEMKLRAYTTAYYGNKLNYQLGVFVMIVTGSADPGYSIRFFKEGAEVEGI